MIDDFTFKLARMKPRKLTRGRFNSIIRTHIGDNGLSCYNAVEHVYGELRRSIGLTEEEENRIVDYINMNHAYLGDDKVVYAIRNHITRNVKLGYATDIRSRVNRLNVDNDAVISLECICYTEHYHKMEKELHDMFKEKRVKGEWYKVTDNTIFKIFKKMRVKYG